MKSSFPIIIPFIMFYLTVSAGLGNQLDSLVYFTILIIASLTSIFSFLLSFFQSSEPFVCEEGHKLKFILTFRLSYFELLIVSSYPFVLIANLLFSLGFFQETELISSFPMELLLLLMISSMLYIGVLASRRTTIIQTFFNSLFKNLFLKSWLA